MSRAENPAQGHGEGSGRNSSWASHSDILTSFLQMHVIWGFICFSKLIGKGEHFWLLGVGGGNKTTEASTPY